MTLKTQMTADMSVFFNADDFAVEAVFTPATGSPVTLNVLLEKEVQMQPAGYDAGAYGQITYIEAVLADLPHEPNRGETFLIDGTTYTVTHPLENDGTTVKSVVT